jgi:hypothetical protein
MLYHPLAAWSSNPPKKNKTVGSNPDKARERKLKPHVRSVMSISKNEEKKRLPTYTTLTILHKTNIDLLHHGQFWKEGKNLQK